MFLFIKKTNLGPLAFIGLYIKILYFLSFRWFLYLYFRWYLHTYISIKLYTILNNRNINYICCSSIHSSSIHPCQSIDASIHKSINVILSIHVYLFINIIPFVHLYMLFHLCIHPYISIQACIHPCHSIHPSMPFHPLIRPCHSFIHTTNPLFCSNNPCCSILAFIYSSTSPFNNIC